MIHSRISFRRRCKCRWVPVRSEWRPAPKRRRWPETRLDHSRTSCDIASCRKTKSSISTVDEKKVIRNCFWIFQILRVPIKNSVSKPNSQWTQLEAAEQCQWSHRQADVDRFCPFLVFWWSYRIKVCFLKSMIHFWWFAELIFDSILAIRWQSTTAKHLKVSLLLLTSLSDFTLTGRFSVAIWLISRADKPCFALI